jgi:small subunit ribosomal protein S1
MEYKFLSAMAEKETKQAEVEATEAKAVETIVETTTEQQVTPEQFLKDFNWHNYEEGIDPIADSKLEEFEKLVSENFVDTLDDEVVEGVVVHISDRDAIIDINAKSEGVISNVYQLEIKLKFLLMLEKMLQVS